MKEHPRASEEVHPLPKSKEVLRWLGPGFLWMVSASGSGELLFSPRVGALYGYTLIWALLAAVVLKWFINREIGRYTVCTGATVMDGFVDLPGPRYWAIYLILVPQLFVAVATIAGLAGSAATALVLVLPGNVKVWTVGSILLSTALVFWGRFKTIEKVATVLAVALSLAAVAAAIKVSPHGSELAKGLIPSAHTKINYGEILPWLGFMLSGAAGMIWYSYWIQKKGYGAAHPSPEKGSAQKPKRQFTATEKDRLKGWLRLMTLDNTVAVVGTLIITLAFLILGAELLKPKGLVPEENKVAEVLGQLLGHVWGPVGFWFMIVGVFVGFWDTVLSDQDGFGRMFAGGSRIVAAHQKQGSRWKDEVFLKRLFVVTVLTIFPIILYFVKGEPVELLKIAGAIEASHIPVVTAMILFLNHKELPPPLKPSRGVTWATAFAGVFFAVFAVIYILQITGVVALE